MNKHNILVVDDHAIMRKGLKVLLTDLYPQCNVYETNSSEALLGYLRQYTINLLIIDIQMPDIDTISLVELISIKYPATYILVFSMLPENIYGRRLLKAGANGFLSKNSSLEEMKEALQIVMQSKRFVSKSLAVTLANHQHENKSADPFSRLSYREFEILSFLVAGSNINHISQTLNLKPSTIGTYKARIFEKLQVKTIFELKDLAVLYNFNSHVLKNVQ
jgi:two-component system, NarL family, invasion response regulator UvrY